MDDQLCSLPTILVFESHASHRKFITSNLENRGFLLIYADSLSQITSLTCERLNAMVISLSYRDVEDGALTKLVREPAIARVPILLLTTFSPYDMLASIILPPNIKYTLAKPFSVARLVAAVQQMVAA